MYFAALLIGALIGATAAQTDCTVDFCQNGGVCVIVQGSASCACMSGFTGRNCENGSAAPTTAAPTTPCSNAPCTNGGTCTPVGEIFICTCPSGYSGTVCQVSAVTAAPTTAAPTTPCSNAPCNNGGTCTPVGAIFVCTCPSGYTGNMCQDMSGAPTTTSPTTACDNAPCINGGTCTAVGDIFACTCPSGYTGTVCQVMSGAVTAAPTTAAPAPVSCPAKKSDKNNVGCVPAEVVFMIEYARGDNIFDIDHEGDFIKRVIDGWQVDDQNMRIGVVTYHDTVSEVIHIDDYPNNPLALKDRITQMARRLRPTGINDLAAALEYVRTTSFTNARPDAEKIVIPIVHMMPDDTRAGIINAATQLKNDCVTIIGMGVRNSRQIGGDQEQTNDATVDAQIMANVVTAPANTHYQQYRDFSSLENAARNYDNSRCS